MSLFTWPSRIPTSVRRLWEHCILFPLSGALGGDDEAQDDLPRSVLPGRRAALLAVRSVVAQNGLNVSLFFHQLFADRISAFFGMDVFVSAVVLLVFMRTEGPRLRIPGRWLPVTALILVGVSLALPLFLYLREHKLGQAQPVLTGQATG